MTTDLFLGAPDAPAFSIHLPVYEGPLDVLLRLIEERKLEITAVSLAAVADQFLAYLAGLPQRDPRLLAGFVSIAARLLLIKSRALLPLPARAEPAEDEETEALVEQLRAYQLYKQVAQLLRQREQLGLRAFPVQPPPLPRDGSRFVMPDNVTPEALAKAMQRVVERWMPPPTADAVVAPLPFTVNDCISKIQRALSERPRVTFREVLANARSRIEVIVHLLALLELLKRYAVRCYQEALFGEIVIEPMPESERPSVEIDAALEFEE
ncbi:MAG: ScpA family protein [Anaerolineae bacterium]|nr:segregation/condensation protein A [Thermoflexales bacterium]MDW8394832.1 ScpA family protein [Anaerolineae bacterium]